jgi:uncharacterized protein YbcI
MPPDRGLEGTRAQIADELLCIHEESYGLSADNVKVHLHEDAVVVTLDIHLSESERTLISAGRGDAVKHTREAYQEVIKPTFVAVVERATGRRVVSFFSFTSVEEPIYSCEFFRLGDHEASGAT